MKATAIAFANIALIKYWGKRDGKLILPHNGSISMTCDGLQAITTVEWGDFPNHSIRVNDDELKKDEKDLLGHIDRIAQLAGITKKAKIVSETNFPVAAGLASSAAGLAALTLAATTAAGLKLREKELSILARQGSGSASRSVCGGFVEWLRGTQADGNDSYAQVIAPASFWPEFRMLACIVSEKKKSVSSRGGMAQTVQNCPYFPAWVESATRDLGVMREAIKKKNFTVVGQTAELNALKMHATMMTTTPPIIYWTPETMEVIHAVQEWREAGLECYFTMDAGPQVKVLCLEKDQKELEKRLTALNGVKKTIACKPGEGARIINKHLF